MSEVTIENIIKKATEMRGKHLDIFALAFQQALGCRLDEIELVQKNRGNEIIWCYRKKEQQDG